MSYDLGDVVPLSITVTDADGVSASAGNMALTITLPDATTFTVATVVPTSPGVYAYAYPASQAGRHTVRWLATAPNACAHTDVFDVRPAVPPMLFSLAAAKTKLDIPATSTDDDEELREFIEATTRCVEYFIGPVVRRTVAQIVRGGRPEVLLDTTPVLSLTGAVGLQPSQEAVDVAGLDADADTGVVRRTDGLPFPAGDYRWTYVVGRTAVPERLLAAKLILQHLWRTNYGASRGVSAIGGGDDFIATEQVPGFGYAIPNRALQLLQPDRQMGLRMMTSRVPAAIDALLTLIRARPALDEVAVEDGPPSVNLTQLQRIHIGWQPGADSAVSLEQSFNAAGARTRDEAFLIHGYAEARAGDRDMQARRNEVFALVGEIEQALRATDDAPTAPTLNGTVLWAHLTTGDLIQVQAEGSLAGLAFAVSCQARI